MNKHDRLEKVTEQLFHLDEAIDHLNQVGHCEDIVEMLNDRSIILTAAKNALHKCIEQDDRRDLRDLTREYWRAVL